MSDTTGVLRLHHKHCDDLFAQADASAYAGDWPACEATQAKFCAEIEAHFETEEQVLFPAFDRVSGISGGPVAVMRMEHAQMRELIDQMNVALAAHDAGTFTGAADTLLILMQQHNMKEENILYPMCDRSLGPSDVNVEEALSGRLERECQR